MLLKITGCMKTSKTKFMLEEKRKTGMMHYIILKIIILGIVLYVLVVASIYTIKYRAAAVLSQVLLN